jgi:hypothetical protein
MHLPTLVAQGMIKCILLFSFTFKPSHDVIFDILLAKPMFKINKPLLILEQTMHVTS